jgi:hypothetical protein
MGAALGDIIGVAIAGFLAVALLSILVTRMPATPPFARRAPATSTIQLRQDPNAGFILDRGFLFRRRCWFAGTCCSLTRIEVRKYGDLLAAQAMRPVSVARSGIRVWWWFEGEFTGNPVTTVSGTCWL